jgi:hypothetical protein
MISADDEKLRIALPKFHNSRNDAYGNADSVLDARMPSMWRAARRP